VLSNGWSQVAACASLSGGLELQSVHTARDGTHKLVFALKPADSGDGVAGSGTVETVLIPMTSRSGAAPRYTACVSTQVGCAMNCQASVVGHTCDLKMDEKFWPSTRGGGVTLLTPCGFLPRAQDHLPPPHKALLLVHI
jgi:adenine C2-methylase RlmN of 23S rRNA A2503 and tRNA A37